MRAATTLLVGLLIAADAGAKTVESFQVVVTNEVQAEHRDMHYLETLAWAQKSWTSFNRSTHTFYFGTEILLVPVEGAEGQERMAFDVYSLIFGYKLRTYLPDWYNFQVRLRIPFAAPSDPYGRADCVPGEESLACAEKRTLTDRLELRVDPMLLQKSWNLLQVYDRNRLTLTPTRLEYGNKFKLIDMIPDLSFPIATYAGLDLRLRRDNADGALRARNDFLVGMASNFTDWLHLAVDLMYRLDTKPGAGQALLATVYLELNFDIFFDNTFGGATKRKRDVRQDARD